MNSIQKFFILFAKGQKQNNGFLRVIFGRKSNLIRRKSKIFCITVEIVK